jgi:adenylate cyclase
MGSASDQFGINTEKQPIMYRLRTFGGLGIDRDGTRLDQIEGHRKALALLAILAAQGSVGRERLMAMLWPESDAKRARGSLNQAVHLLRRHLVTPDLLLGATELRLNPARIGSDVSLFIEALERRDDAGAVRQYEGRFLDGVHIDDAPEFERWAAAHSSYLARRYAEALENLAQEAESKDRPDDAVRWWRRLESADPLSSRTAINLMRALEASGDRAAALRHARLHQERLRDEWDINPDPDVAAFAEQLQWARPQRSTSPRSIIPIGPGAPASEPDNLQSTQVPIPQQTRGSAFAPHRAALRTQTRAALIIGAGVVALMAVWGLRGGLGVSKDARTVVTPAQGSIAVMPFEDLSPERDQEYFSDGMAEELINRLATVGGLKVVARTSAFQFKGRNPDIRDLRESLQVEHVLEGSVRKADNRVRISVQLVDTESGVQVWSETYDRFSDDVFGVQEEISRAVLDALQIRLPRGFDPLHLEPLTTDFEAYEMYLKGLHFFNRLQIHAAIENLIGATNRDPQFARAFAALAEAYAVPAAYSDRSPLENREKGLAAAQAALRIDSDLAEAHAALGWLQMIDLRWDEAEVALKRAIALDSRAPRARLYYAFYLHRQGSLTDAFEQIQRARELDPLSSPISALYGSFLSDMGRNREAIAHLESSLEVDPDFPIAHVALAHIHLGAGRHDEAIRHYEHVFARVPTSFYAGFLGHAYARSGRIENAERILAELQAQQQAGAHVSPGAIGWILLGLQETGDGFRWLERAAQQRDVFLTIYGVLSNRYLIGPYEDDQRFLHVRRAVGLPL